MKVKIKKLHPDAVIPAYAKPGDGAMDIVATSLSGYEDKIVYGTNLAFEIPDGHCALLLPRSSICKYDLRLSNSVGLLDSQYRGEVKFVFTMNTPVTENFRMYKIGDRIGQLMIIPYPQIEFEEVEELSETERGSGGFGSSGN